MQRSVFNAQMQRLINQWPKAYGPERLARLWQVWKNVPDELFIEMVNEAIDTCRGAPLVSDFSKLELEVKKRNSFSRESFGLSKFSIEEINKNQNYYADPEFVKLAAEIRKKIGKIPFSEYLKLTEDLEKLAKSYKT